MWLNIKQLAFAVSFVALLMYTMAWSGLLVSQTRIYSMILN